MMINYYYIQIYLASFKVPIILTVQDNKHENLIFKIYSFPLILGSGALHGKMLLVTNLAWMIEIPTLPYF